MHKILSTHNFLYLCFEKAVYETLRAKVPEGGNANCTFSRVKC